MCMRVVSRFSRTCGLFLCVALVSAGVAFGQASSTINGRVLDQGDAVLPGCDGHRHQPEHRRRAHDRHQRGRAVFPPGPRARRLQRATELPGFQTSMRQDVTIGVNATLTRRLQAGGGRRGRGGDRDRRAPLIEVTQSKVASSIEATELQNLPLVTRNVSGMLALLPGAVQIEPVHRSKTNVGSVSYGGSAGTNVIPSVDGADNRDNQFGGPLLAYSTEAIEQFQLATSQFNAADGRTGGAALTMVTKSGTNALHGSAFGFGRSDKR